MHAVQWPLTPKHVLKCHQLRLGPLHLVPFRDRELTSSMYSSDDYKVLTLYCGETFVLGPRPTLGSP